MEELSRYMRERHDYMAGRLNEGKIPNGAQLSSFLKAVCGSCAPLVKAEVRTHAGATGRSCVRF